MELLDLVLFRDISKLLQEAFQVTGQEKGNSRGELESRMVPGKEKGNRKPT